MWAVEAEKDKPVMALSFGSLSEAFYEALIAEPDNPQLVSTLAKGLETKLLSVKTPMSVLRLLVNLHNKFHSGAATSYLELIQCVPNVPRPQWCMPC